MQREDSQVNTPKKPRALFQPSNTCVRIMASPIEAKAAYHSLLDLLVCSTDKSSLHALINSLEFPNNTSENLSEDEDIAFFHALNNSINARTRHLLINFRNTSGIRELNSLIMETVRFTEYYPVLPSENDYPDNANVLHGLGLDNESELSNVLQNIILALNAVGLGVCFLPAPPDTIVIFLYRLIDEEKIDHLVCRTGLGLGSTH